MARSGFGLVAFDCAIRLVLFSLTGLVESVDFCEEVKPFKDAKGLLLRESCQAVWERRRRRE
jgi:hypothetical protein